MAICCFAKQAGMKEVEMMQGVAVVQSWWENTSIYLPNFFQGLRLLPPDWVQLSPRHNQLYWLERV